MRTRHHFGVYGLHRENGHVLAVRKTRGPYTGQLDLPGGSPEANETWMDTLLRELAEETGGRLAWFGPWEQFQLRVTESSTGQAIDFRHRAVWCLVQIEAIDFQVAAYEDTDGLEWVEVAGWRARTDLALPLREVLAHVDARPDTH